MITEQPSETVPQAFADNGAPVAGSMGKNTVFGIVANVIQLLTRFITIPIVISHLGLEGYGIWSIIMAAAAYMRFGSVGIKSAFQKYVAEATSNGAFLRANQLISTGTILFLGVSIAGLVPVSLFSLPIARAAGIPANFLADGAGSISLLAGMMIVSNVGAAYEAVVMGAHRIDLTRKVNTLMSVAEAASIVVLLHLGYGLFAMSAVMATSEVIYVFSCFIAARRILPAIEIRPKHFEAGVLREVVTFAGSYQLVGILEVLYAAVLPVTVLRLFGAHAAGLFALTNRLVAAALLPQDAFITPLLSGGSYIVASGSLARIHELIRNSFKTVLTMSVLPLAFLAAYGSMVVLAWIGQVDESFRIVLWLTCVSAFFKAVSSAELILYRASGRSSMDTIRQLLRLAILISIACGGRYLGFVGLLWGLALTELIGMLFMYFSMIKVYGGFRGSVMIPNALKLAYATALVLGLSATAAFIRTPLFADARQAAVAQLLFASLIGFVAVVPALLLTGAISRSEARMIVGLLAPAQKGSFANSQ